MKTALLILLLSTTFACQSRQSTPEAQPPMVEHGVPGTDSASEESHIELGVVMYEISKRQPKKPQWLGSLATLERPTKPPWLRATVAMSKPDTRTCSWLTKVLFDHDRGQSTNAQTIIRERSAKTIHKVNV